MDFAQVFNNMAFPLACCIAMGWYVYHMSETHREDTKLLNKQHEEAETKITEAINNNTLVMTQICERLGVIEDNRKEIERLKHETNN